MDEEVEGQDQGLFVIIDREALSAVEELLGPADGGGSRVVDGDDSRSILTAREAELVGLSKMFHDRYRRCADIFFQDGPLLFGRHPGGRKLNASGAACSSCVQAGPSKTGTLLRLPPFRE